MAFVPVISEPSWIYGTDGVEVEFVQAAGQTKALVTLRTEDLRSVAESDVLAVRSA